MSKLKDQIEGLSEKTPKKHKEIEKVREKLGNTEARCRSASICKSFGRTKDNKQEKEKIFLKSGDKFPKIKNKMKDFRLKRPIECQRG